MKRKIYQDLLKWKNTESKIPLMVVGARQIGKTYIIDEFCKKEFKKYIYINLLETPEIVSIFSRDINVMEKFKRMEIFLDTKIDIENTVIFFDEVQESEDIISSLKFFCESEEKFKIICAGSLLGVKYNDIILDNLEIYKGIITENYVATQFVSNKNDLYYWSSSNKAEIDFLLYNDDGIIPVEVKANKNIKSKSLNIYIEKFKPKYSIRISNKNFGFENGIKSVPLYAIFCIK